MSRQPAAGSGQPRAVQQLPAASRLLPAASVLWQFAIPGLALLFFAYRDRYDGKPPYVIPWFLFAAIVGAAWTAPIPTSPRRQRRFRFAIPMWVWPWLALAGVLVYRS